MHPQHAKKIVATGYNTVRIWLNLTIEFLETVHRKFTGWQINCPLQSSEVFPFGGKGTI